MSKQLRDDISAYSRSNTSKKTGSTQFSKDKPASLQSRTRQSVQGDGDSISKKSNESSGKTQVEEFKVVEEPKKRLRLGKKTKVIIFSLILVGIIIIILPVIIAYATGYNTIVVENPSEGEESVFNDQEVFDRLGLVAMDTPQSCELQQLIVSKAELNGRKLYDYLEEAGFTDCFFSQFEILSPLKITEQEFADLTFLIANRMSKSSGQDLEFGFGMVDASAEQLNLLFGALQDKQWFSISFTSGSLNNMDEQGAQLLEKLVLHSKELQSLNFRISSAPDYSITMILEALLRSESIKTLRKLGLVGQKLTDDGIFALLTVTKYATQLNNDQPDTTLTEVQIQKREDAKFIYAFKDFGSEYFHSIPWKEKQ